MVLLKSALFLVLGLVLAASEKVKDGPCEHEELLQHESDCAKFYQCAHGKLFSFHCPDDLHWNDEEKKCDWPENAKCVKGVCDIASPPPVCPEHDPLGPVVLLSHQYDCTKFYKCDWGKLHLFDCPNGSHFNPESLSCDWPEDAGCPCARRLY